MSIQTFFIIWANPCQNWNSYKCKTQKNNQKKETKCHWKSNCNCNYSFFVKNIWSIFAIRIINEVNGSQQWYKAKEIHQVIWNIVYDCPIYFIIWSKLTCDDVTLKQRNYDPIHEIWKPICQYPVCIKPLFFIFCLLIIMKILFLLLIEIDIKWNEDDWTKTKPPHHHNSNPYKYRWLLSVSISSHQINTNGEQQKCLQNWKNINWHFNRVCMFCDASLENHIFFISIMSKNKIYFLL